MRSYGQFCALARSLDLIGDRWTLLIIRELFARDSRYSDIKDALPGIATNLLADRLRQLQAAGVVEAYEAPPPVRATVYRLTPRGRELGPVLRSLVRWGMPLAEKGQGDDAFRPQWLMLMLRVLFGDTDTDDVSPLTVVVETGGEPITLEVDGGVTTHLGPPRSQPDVELRGEPEAVRAFLTGADSENAGDMSVAGTKDAVDRLNTLIARAGPAAEDRAS